MTSPAADAVAVIESLECAAEENLREHARAGQVLHLPAEGELWVSGYKPPPSLSWAASLSSRASNIPRVCVGSSKALPAALATKP